MSIKHCNGRKESLWAEQNEAARNERVSKKKIVHEQNMNIEIW